MYILYISINGPFNILKNKSDYQFYGYRSAIACSSYVYYCRQKNSGKRKVKEKKDENKFGDAFVLSVLKCSYLYPSLVDFLVPNYTFRSPSQFVCVQNSKSCFVRMFSFVAGLCDGTSKHTCMHFY